MKIVIDIPSNLKIMNEQMNVLLSCEIDEIREAIKNGTPLPKGHGRLIDADAKNKELTDDYHGMISDESMKIYKIIQMLDDAPTIIEADKESD